jgi:hypothetical protein
MASPKSTARLKNLFVPAAMFLIFLDQVTGVADEAPATDHEDRPLAPGHSS